MILVWHHVTEWWTTHSGWVTFIYFVVALWASLYSDRARRVVVAPIRIPASWMARYMDRDLDNQIEVLKYMHTDTYHLVHYLVFYLLHALFYVVWWTLGMSVVVVLIFYRSHPLQLGFTPLGFLFGGFIARLLRLQTTLEYLFDYDGSMSRLEAMRAKYK
jgi:hypothetical protein